MPAAPQGTLPLVTGLTGALAPADMLLPLAADPASGTFPAPLSVFAAPAPVAPAAPVAAAPVPLPAGSLALVLVPGAVAPSPLLLDPQALAQRATTSADIPTSDLRRSTFIDFSLVCAGCFHSRQIITEGSWHSVALALSWSFFLLSVKGQPRE